MGIVGASWEHRDDDLGAIESPKPVVRLCSRDGRLEGLVAGWELGARRTGALGAAAASVLARPTQRSRGRFALEEARALSLARRNKDAARAGSRAVELIDFVDPQDRGRGYVALGHVFVVAGDTKRARDIYSEAIKVLSESGRPYVMAAATRLSELLEKQGDVKGALAVLKRAAAVAPDATAPAASHQLAGT
jgi:tetratricopeptide (TPR) repeat protein